MATLTIIPPFQNISDMDSREMQKSLTGFNKVICKVTHDSVVHTRGNTEIKSN